MDSARLAKKLYRNLRILAVLTVVFLGTLAIAPAKEWFTEWRGVQKQYNEQAAALGLATMEVGIKQIWRPEIDLVDRCTSCHVGMGTAAPLPEGGPVFGAHPSVHHDVAQMGCTICHRGQGRATKKEAAHGLVKHWEEPMLERPYLEASCGGCHGDAARVPAAAKVERGRYLFDLHGCKSCHVVDGEGGRVGPDLSGVALKGYDREWQIRHLRDPAATVEGSKMMSFGHLSDADVDSIVTYLDTLIGAPMLMRGKALAVELGCRGCHRIGGVGGDHGPDLSDEGSKSAGDFDFSHVDGPHTASSWHRAHLRNPKRVAPGSKMPSYRLPEEDEEALITYVLSLRQDVVPMDDLPKQTILAQLHEKRDFASDGETLYQTFCAVCHGADGQGKQMDSLGVTVPALINSDLLAVASVDYLRYTIEHGRPGRDMPGWSLTNAGLRPEETEAIIRYLRAGVPTPPSYEEVAAVETPSIDLGATIYRHDCAGCHGLKGEGTVIAPSLVNPELLFVASDHLLYRTITAGRANTGMPAHRAYSGDELAGLLAWIRGQGPVTAEHRRRYEETISEVLHVRKLDDYRAGGSPAYGRVIYESMCIGCHGSRGHGGVGTAITNRDFLDEASDGFIAGTILLGRGQRAMRPFGPAGLANLRGREIADLIAYLRYEGGQPADRPRGRHVQGSSEAGKERFAQLCSGCHGPEGKGASAPALNNSGFLTAATDGFLQATIARGRRGTAMRAWARGGYGFAEIPPSEINDIVSYLRTWEQ